MSQSLGIHAVWAFLDMFLLHVGDYVSIAYLRVLGSLLLTRQKNLCGYPHLEALGDLLHISMPYKVYGNTVGNTLSLYQ